MKRLLLILPLFVLSMAVNVAAPNVASAANGADFQPGRIIDDQIFYDKNSMSVADIQNFLADILDGTANNGVNKTCDTNGDKIYSGTTLRKNADPNYPPPYICLTNYYENPTTHENNLTKADKLAAPIPAGGISAAQIIYNAAQNYGINPKVLIVMIQKESLGGLLTDDWPWYNQYKTPMGYGCPDATVCDAQYFGFYNQVWNAARQYRLYATNPNNYNYVIGLNNIKYHPNAACGTTPVTIVNQATANLYNYTPYVPNASALANLYGTGDGCASYGNRNFWRMFTDWFGSTRAVNTSTVSMATITGPDTTPAIGQTINYVVSFTNNLSSAITVDGIGVVGRAGSLTNGVNRDFGWQGPITLQPGVAQQFTFTTVIRDNGAIYAWPAIYYGGTYIQYNNWGTAMDAHLPSLTLVSSLTLSSTSPVAGQTITLSASIRNDEGQPILLDSIGIPIRYYGVYGYDTAWASAPGTIQPGATQIVSGSVVFDKPGPYTAWVSALIAGRYTTLSPTISITTAKVSPSFILTYIETPNTHPALGEDVTVSFKLKNTLGVPITIDAVGVVGRYGSPGSGSASDLGWAGPVTFAASEEKSFTTFVSTISAMNNLYVWPAILYQGSYTQYSPWGFALTPHLPNISISTPLSVNAGATPVLGSPSTVTVSLKNNEPKPIQFTAAGIPIRFYGAYNYDAVWQGPGIFGASGQSGDTVALSGIVTFDKHGPYTIWASVYSAGRYMTIGSPINLAL